MYIKNKIIKDDTNNKTDVVVLYFLNCQKNKIKLKIKDCKKAIK
ncbi:hypothetical protein [Mesomycoplasma neurolyticum]|uniref:Uncharacterized protein n=1 Tax=Mesomycoplasma neurolyticum TaxID=2120 RepID=A0A449A4N6_9BACT|nr:hypothetical protein [Mesomycoplasma neurolyticum]VEU59174.1 Uncharacterised protein [Mesomycoplasma neurolyticum]